MITTYTSKDLTWLDIESPTTEEVKSLMEKYSLSPEVGQDLLSPNAHRKIEYYDDHIHLILHFPAFKHSHANGTIQEVDFILGKDYIITVRYDTIDTLHKFSKIFETNAILEHESVGEHAGHIFFHMITKIYKSLGHELAFIQDNLNAVEDKIFTGQEKEVVQELSMISRELINFKQVLGQHEEVLELFKSASERFYGKEFVYYADAIYKEYQKTHNDARNKKEFLTELRETNDSLLDSKQNEIMKNLTVMAFFTFPLSLLVSLFILKNEYPEIIGSSYDFWIIIGFLFIVLLTMLIYFKRKKWM